jgi:hypothetical protein
MAIDRTEISYLDMMMEMDQMQGKRIVMFHLCSLGQVQFIAPIWREILRQQLPWSLFLACDYDIRGRVPELNIPDWRSS